MEIKEMISRLQEYFMNKVLNGDFTVIRVTRYYITVEIDDYLFNFWVANGKEFFKVYITENNFMNLYIKDSDKPAMYRVIMDKAKTFYNEMHREETLKKLKDLKDELDMLEND